MPDSGIRPGALFLVAVIPEPRDLEIVRLLGWYRIRFRSAPKVVAVDYLAFYQPAAFGPQHRWQIEHICEVRGVELVTRRELFRDQPNHPRANEEYYKIQVGPLQALPQPIPAGTWRRVTFLYTTGDLLGAARSVNDLVVKSDERQVLWRSLRERALQSAGYQVDDLPEIPFDPLLLAMLGEFTASADPSRDQKR